MKISRSTVALMILGFVLNANAVIDLSPYNGRTGQLQYISASGVFNDVLECRIEDFGDSEYKELKNKIGIVDVKLNYTNGDWPRFSYDGQVFEGDISYGTPGKKLTTPSAGGFTSGCEPFERVIPIGTSLSLWPNAVSIEGRILCGGAVKTVIAICRFNEPKNAKAKFNSPK